MYIFGLNYTFEAICMFSLTTLLSNLFLVKKWFRTDTVFVTKPNPVCKVCKRQLCDISSNVTFENQTKKHILNNFSSLSDSLSHGFKSYLHFFSGMPPSFIYLFI